MIEEKDMSGKNFDTCTAIMNEYINAYNKLNNEIAEMSSEDNSYPSILEKLREKYGCGGITKEEWGI